MLDNKPGKRNGQIIAQSFLANHHRQGIGIDIGRVVIHFTGQGHNAVS